MTDTIRSKQYADSVALEDEEAIIREYHEQWVRERAPTKDPAIAAVETAPRSGP